MFWLFLDRASSKTLAGAVCSGSASWFPLVGFWPFCPPGIAELPSSPSMDSSKASCSVRCSSRVDGAAALTPRSISLKRLVGMLLSGAIWWRANNGSPASVAPKISKQQSQCRRTQTRAQQCFGYWSSVELEFCCCLALPKTTLAEVEK